MATDHAKTVYDLIVAAGVSNVRVGKVEDVDDYPAVFCLSTGGPKPAPLFGNSRAYRQATVQVRVVGPRNDDEDVHQTARSVYDAIDHVQPTGYMSVEPQQSAPIFIQSRAQNRSDYSVNVMCKIFE